MIQSMCRVRWPCTVCECDYPYPPVRFRSRVGKHRSWTLCPRVAKSRGLTISVRLFRDTSFRENSSRHRLGWSGEGEVMRSVNCKDIQTMVRNISQGSPTKRSRYCVLFFVYISYTNVKKYQRHDDIYSVDEVNPANCAGIQMCLNRYLHPWQPA